METTNTSWNDLHDLTNAQLLTRFKVVLKNQRQQLVELLRLLGEIDLRRFYLPRGYGSLFAYCVGEHGFSEDEAGRRIAVARAARCYPLILELLEKGAIHLTGVGLLTKHLTSENHRELLAEACGRTSNDIELLVATRFPKPPQKTVFRPAQVERFVQGSTAPAVAPNGGDCLTRAQVTAVPSPGTTCGASQREAPASASTAGAPQLELTASPSAQPALRPMTAKPRSAEIMRMSIDFDLAMQEDLRRCQELLAAESGRRDRDSIIRESLRLMRRQLEKKLQSPRRTGRAQAKESKALQAPAKAAGEAAATVMTEAPATGAAQATATGAAQATATGAAQATATGAAQATATPGEAAQGLPAAAPVNSATKPTESSAIGRPASAGVSQRRPALARVNSATEPTESSASGGPAPAEVSQRRPALARVETSTQSPYEVSASGSALESVEAGCLGKLSAREGRSRYVPMRIKREVFARDGYQCTFVSADGKRCTCRKFLTLDHIIAFALGGDNSAANLRVRCRAHNQYTAELEFGDAALRPRRSAG